MYKTINKIAENIGLGRHPTARTCLSSASEHFNIIQPQFYFPGFDVVANDDNIIYSPETILNNKYKLINIDYLIDKNLDAAQSAIGSMIVDEIDCSNSEDELNNQPLTTECENSTASANPNTTDITSTSPLSECSNQIELDSTSITCQGKPTLADGQSKNSNKPETEPATLESNSVDTNSCEVSSPMKHSNTNTESPTCARGSAVLELSEFSDSETEEAQDAVKSNNYTELEQNSSGDWTDCSSDCNSGSNCDEESVMSEYDLLANNYLDAADEDYPECRFEDNQKLAEQAKFFEQVRQADKKDNTDNCFSLMATIQKTHKGTIKTYHQKIFCKKAPLIEPLKAIDQTNYPDLLTNATQGAINNILLPDPNTKKIFDKLNSIHNTSHVETLALYSLSKLTELGKCPAFPYYFGSLQGIMPVHYHNITDEIQDYTEYDWFNELIELGLIDVLYIDISEYANLGKEILRSEDITLDISPQELTTDPELQPFKDKLPELIQEFETLMDDTNVDEFISTGRLPCSINDPATREDLKRSQPSSARIEFEDLDEIDIDELKPDDILPIKKFENKLFYLKLENFPVSLSFMEKMTGSLDDDMNSPKPMTEQQLLSVLFQVAFGLAVANKHLSFVHNDLHAGNIMFQSTAQKYLYYSIHGNYYRIPTYNKIAKIIDFARGTFQINDKWIVSDAFEPDNDAGDQYAMPDANGKYGEAKFDQNGHKLPRPNPSFDLALLATILTHYVSSNIPESQELSNMLNHWATDKHGINHVHSPVEFSLYTNIARDCHNAVPKDVLKHKLFQQFKIPRKQIPKRQFIYKF